jgi:hypothetical protein
VAWDDRYFFFWYLLGVVLIFFFRAGRQYEVSLSTEINVVFKPSMFDVNVHGMIYAVCSLQL